MTILATAKSKLNGNVKEAFKNEDGAIDLASIMVGIIVIGIIGGVIAATVFAVIPWAQDNGAKQQLDSVASAESAYIGLSTDAGAGNFGDDAALASQKLFTAPTNVAVAAGSGVGANAHYAAVVRSQTGHTFVITDQNTKPTKGADAADNTGLKAQATAALPAN